jgi:hypothetical protein
MLGIYFGGDKGLGTLWAQDGHRGPKPADEKKRQASK